MAPNSLPQYRCQYIEGVEKVEGYRIGGFCPIAIGQMLDDKYEVIAKLGHGGYSTVWLAKDVTYNSWVAVKILKSEKSSKTNSELAILQSARYATIVQYLGNFWTQSPNGYHLCLVMEVTGPSIRDYVESLWYGMLDSNTAIDLSRQCVTALKTLHDSGFAHGDVCSANFVLGLSDISSFTKESMQRFLGDHRSGLVLSRDGSALPAGVPERLFLSVSFKDLVDPSKVKIIDLGEAFSGCKKGVANHVTSRAPELLAEQAATMQSDIWSIGCLMFELVTTHPPFSIPVGKKQSSFFAKTPDEQYEYLWEFLSRHSVLDYEEENDYLAGLLCHMLVQDQQGRVSLGRVLEHNFFKFADIPPELLG
ncbi:kinase-like protein [Cenococcum geophilum 1.58]|uniref:kinase-like protein n=1 Tax=Cenococcum geophilum 1.58 TaxID=794803 RepID=UPI00358FC97F|nr:kinase-like protein [Cenococcum geophilum 1.58]